MERNNADISIMMIDDEEVILDSLLLYLEDVGFQTSGHTKPEEALEAIKLKAPDVCLVDLRMPGINGEDLIQEIHTIAPSVRCMILSGTFFDISEKLIAIGMCQDDVIRKPIHDYQEFFLKISTPL